MARRTFTLLDAMFLVAAAGLGLYLARMLISNVPVVTPGPVRKAWINWLGASYLFLLGISLGVAVIRVRQPRPPIRSLARQPGFLAEVAVISIVTLGTALSVLDRVAFRGWQGEPFVSRWLYSYLISIGGPWNVGFAVLLAWVIGGLQGFRWGRADWVEWVGRLLGVLWLLFWLGILSLKLLRGLKYL